MVVQQEETHSYKRKKFTREFGDFDVVAYDSVGVAENKMKVNEVMECRKIDKLYNSTRFLMQLLPPGILDSHYSCTNPKDYLVKFSSLQDLITSSRALMDEYNQNIPGSTRLSDGSFLSVEDSEWTNLHSCMCYVKRQLYPLVLKYQFFDDSLLCHYECVLDLFDGKMYNDIKNC